MNKPLRILGAIAISALTLLGMHSVSYANQHDLGLRVRAAFLFNFARFTEWPHFRSDRQLAFCIAGDPALLNALRETIRDKYIRERKLLALDATDANIGRECDVLYLGTQQSLNLIDQAAERILLVGEGADFATRHGMVGFLLREDRLRFAINPQHVESSGLSMSAQLLSLADIVAPAGHKL